jgi:carnitine O-acetyltransferase
MNQYKFQFGTTRIPGDKADTIVNNYPNNHIRHIIVLIRNQIYKVVVIDEQGNRASVRELKKLFYAASKDSLESVKQAPVGLLTAGNRDNWFEAYSKLSKLNSQEFKIIQDSLFAVCLDDFSAPKNLDSSHLQIFHNFDARNRWFDKAIQLIVSSNGRAGVNGEHTPADAVIPGRMMDYIIGR